MVFALSFPTSPHAYNHQLVTARLDTVFRRVREWPRDSEISGESDGQEQAAGSIHFYRQLLVCVLIDALLIRIYAIWRRRFPFLSFFFLFSSRTRACLKAPAPPRQATYCFPPYWAVPRGGELPESWMARRELCG